MFRFTWITVLIVLLDQASKLVLTKMLAGAPVELLPFLKFSLTFNTGAAFGFLNQASGWQNWFFIGVASVVSVIIFSMIRNLTERDRQTAVALFFVLGGAIGNLVDRIRLGYVIDFIDFYYRSSNLSCLWTFYPADGGCHFPVFNVADSAITIGAVLLILDMLGVRIFRHEK